jgi:hypothetical protein
MRKGTRKTRPLTPVYEIIFELSKLFGGQCEMCGKKMRKAQSGFTIHHLCYREGEKTHKNFLDRLKYYKYLAPIVYFTQELGILSYCFAFLCNQCHNSLDGIRGINRRKKINVLRLIMMWYRTNT